MTEQVELTVGQKLVGITFNPSGDPKVQKAKELCAELTDLIGDEVINSELQRIIFDKAIGNILDAQMTVVKALTFKY